MRILLILNSKATPGAGIIVIVKEQAIKNQVIALLQGKKEREAFDLLKKKAEPETYLAPGEKPNEKLVTLIEQELV